MANDAAEKLACHGIEAPAQASGCLAQMWPQRSVWTQQDRSLKRKAKNQAQSLQPAQTPLESTNNHLHPVHLLPMQGSDEHPANKSQMLACRKKNSVD
jgi:hypothetical protein